MFHRYIKQEIVKDQCHREDEDYVTMMDRILVHLREFRMMLQSTLFQKLRHIDRLVKWKNIVPIDLII